MLRSPRSPSPVRTRAATARERARARAASAASASAASPVARAASAASPPKRAPATARASRAASPPKRAPATARAPSPRHRRAPKRDPNDPYATPFWPPSNYSVPAKVISNSPTPLPRTLAKHKAFIEELRPILINEKIIDRDSPLFKGLLEEQQKYNMIFHRLKPYNIICFVKCDYYLYDKSAPRVFHKGNKEPYFGNYQFANLLKRNNMNMKWWGNNILYIHKNRF